MKRSTDYPNATKKRRMSSLMKSARYPLSFLYSNMMQRRSPLCLTNSTLGIVVAAPPQPTTCSIYSLSGDIYTFNNTNNSKNVSSVPHTIKKTPIRQIEDYHKQHVITHLQWNQKGTTLVSADESGKMALWNLENSVENWSLTYEVDLRQPIAAIQWLNSDREYVASRNGTDCVFTREPVVGPRNPFGYLALVVVTVHGEITIHYQRNGSIFSTFSTTIPKTGHRDISRGSTGYYGMSLAGLDDWQRLSHASMTLDKNGDLYLATYYSECHPKAVYLYNISIKFPGKLDSGAIFCQSIPDLRFITAPEPSLQSITNPETTISHILLSNSPQGIVLNVCFGEFSDSNTQYSGYYGKWTIQNTTQQIPCNYFDGDNFEDDTITRKRTELKYVSGFALTDRFITSISCTRSGQLGIGLSDGTIHMEFQDRTAFGLLQCSSDDNTMVSLNSSFWQVTGTHSFEDGSWDPVVGITFSPCETHLIHMLSSGRIGSGRITKEIPIDDTDLNAGTITTLEQLIKLSLLNQIDNLDLTSELIRIGQLQSHKDIQDIVINNALMAYESFFYQDDVNALEAMPSPDTIKQHAADDWDLARSRLAYGLAIGTYRYIPSKRIEFTNLIKAIQLPIILECFMGSCTSDLADILNVFDSTTVDNNKKNLSFAPDSLWSLVSLSSWTFDYIRWILKEWNMLFNTLHPKNSDLHDLSSKPVHAVLLVHKESRMTLMKTLVMIEHFIRYATNSQFELEHIPETKQLLLRHISTTLQSEPVAINDILLFLRAIDNIKGLDINDTSRWSILVSSKLSSGLDELKKVTAEHKKKCAIPAIYLETHKDEPVDVIRKRRIMATGGHVQSCIRCRQLYLPVIANTVDPATFSSWFQSLKRRCVCGGLFF
ncbi:hypothetical protein BC941DRAFT_505814 [Chlamydoabsidia padenii]|nr:hypothetical protein BC941DRAFT_505814 [Chlamydoabsidia padenii]